MQEDYFKIAIRTFWKNKSFSSINITGLSIAMACFTIILLYVNNELSFDRYHKNAADIYRVVKDFVNDDGTKFQMQLHLQHWLLLCEKTCLK